MLFTLTHHAYCGMPIPLVEEQEQATREEARDRAARRLRYLRSEGMPIVTREKGERWEVLCPEDAVLVPDYCGELVLRGFDPLARKYGKCRECGFDSEWIEDGRGDVYCSCQETEEWSEEEG